MNVNQAVENPKLLQAIKRLRADDSEESQKSFYEELKNAYFLLPSTLENGQLTIKQMNDVGGNVFFPAFTDWRNLKRASFSADHQAVIFSIEDYAKAINANETVAGIVINPFSDNLVVSRANINYLLQNRGNMLKKGENVAVGIPKNYPDELERALKTIFNERGTVRCAYLLQTIKRERDKSYVVVIDTTEEVKNFYPIIDRCAKKFLRWDESIEVVPLRSTYGRNITIGYEPFFNDKDSMVK